MAERKRREILPVELAALVDVAERPRTDNWSLRAALTRYAQPQPTRVSRLLEPIRRLEAALAAHTDLLRNDGTDIWTAFESGSTPPDAPAEWSLVLGLLAAAAEIDRVGDLLADWAVDRQGDRPDDDVTAVTDDVTARLDALGVPEEERVPPPGARRRG